MKTINRDDVKKQNVNTQQDSNSPKNTVGSKAGDISDPYKSKNSSVFSEQDNGSYFHRKKTEAEKGTTSQTVASLNQILERRNEEEKSESVIHGMSDAEYEEYREYMLREYGIQLERGYNYGNFQNVAVAMGESCSQGTRYSAMCKAAQSYDTVLDLVLDAKLSAAIADIFNGDTDPNWERLCSSGNSGRLLKEYGIKITKCADRQYCVSLVDENGKVIQDADGHLAQVYKNDYLLPDGQAQQNEVQLGAALDAMGFDCWSVMDLSAEEYAMVKELAGLKNSELGQASNIDGGNELAIRDQVLGTYDKATRTWSKAKKQDNSAWINGTYTDKVTGKQMSARKRYNQFLAERGSYGNKGKEQDARLEKYKDKIDYAKAFKNQGEFEQKLGIVGSSYTSVDGESSLFWGDTTRQYVSLRDFDRLVKEIMEQEQCSKQEATRIAKKTYRTFRDSTAEEVARDLIIRAMY